VGYGPAGSKFVPIAGDWTGQGTTTIGLYNPANSTFYLRDSNTAGPANSTFNFGPAGAGWIPLAGDWNGDGVTTVGLYNPSTGTFYLDNTNAPGAAGVTFTFDPGHPNWLPIVGDWNGDGKTTVGLYDPLTSKFYLKNSNSSGAADLSFTFGTAGAGWLPITGDWNHDGVDTVGLYAPGNSEFYLRNVNSSGAVDVSFIYGPAGSGWRPITGAWNALPQSTASAAPPAAAMALRTASLDVTWPASMAQPTAPGLAQVTTADWIAPIAAGGPSTLALGPSTATAGGDQPLPPATFTRTAATLDPRAVDRMDLETMARSFDWLDGMVTEELAMDLG
jgi:hypothetical protein